MNRMEKLEWRVRELTAQLAAKDARIAELEGAAECLSMVRERLEVHGCLHGTHDGGQTPPMMYPEWVDCVVAKAAGKNLPPQPVLSDPDGPFSGTYPLPPGERVAGRKGGGAQ